jgi:hypothetical protein
MSSFLGGIFGGPDAPAMDPDAQEYWKTVFSGDRLGEKEESRLSDLFQTVLSSGTDPSKVAFDISMLGKMYPKSRTFQPGGRTWTDAYKQSYTPSKKSKKDALDKAQQTYLSALGRTMNPEELKYYKKERPSLQEVAGIAYSNPASNFAQAETPQEEIVSAMYGRLAPTTDPRTGAVGFTGARYGLKIDPLKYQGYRK